MLKSKLMKRTQRRLPLWLALFLAPIAPCSAQTVYYNTVFGFDFSNTSTGVIKGDDGALYGTTSNVAATSGGLIFRTTVDGANPENLYQLGTNSTDGYAPNAELLLASDGYFYGTTSYGPPVAYPYQDGGGTIFKIKQNGTEFQTIHYFDDPTAVDSSNSVVLSNDGARPDVALIEGPDGNLYGATAKGNPDGTGTVFRIAKNGANFTVLHTFSGLDSSGFNVDGAYPSGRLAFAGDGRLYGVTREGGAGGNGTVYGLGLGGEGFSAVHSFSALDSNNVNEDGATPFGGLVEVNGVLYGTTSGGGTSNYGAVYSLDLGSGVLTTLRSFATATDSTPDGVTPLAGLVLADDGRLYGTTSTGSVSPYGTVFAIGTDGSNYEVLHSFAQLQGSGSKSELFKYDATTYYGTQPGTSGTGPCGYGSVYRISLIGSLPDGKIAPCATYDYGGGGSMGGVWLLGIAVFGLAPRMRRWLKRAPSDGFFY